MIPQSIGVSSIIREVPDIPSFQLNKIFILFNWISLFPRKFPHRFSQISLSASYFTRENPRTGLLSSAGARVIFMTGSA